MGIIAWIVLGLIAGFIASKIYSARAKACCLISGSASSERVVGGYLFSALGSTGITASTFGA